VTDGDVQEQIERLNQEATLLFRQGQYEQAISIATQAHDLVRQHLGKMIQS
jgi:Flp pilus assembly protein TadD